MPEKTTVTIMLTPEQQREVLAATGLLVTCLEVDTTSLEESGVPTASFRLPEWLTPKTTSE
jgi:hypothetical protein